MLVGGIEEKLVNVKMSSGEIRSGKQKWAGVDPYGAIKKHVVRVLKFWIFTYYTSDILFPAVSFSILFKKLLYAHKKRSYCKKSSRILFY